VSALTAGTDFLRWWICLFVIQAAAWPLVHGVFRRSPDRGLAYARPVGLLSIGFVFWLGAVLGLWPNSSSSAWFAVLIVFAVGLAWARRDGRNPWSDLRALRGRLLGQEVIFLVAFAAWAFVRMNNPEALGTEKPMELAFINAVLKSTSFPPNDPWLSGYAISYYHFGYILVGMLAKLASVAGGVAFNLAVASWFGLAAQTSTGLLQNLLGLRESGAHKGNSFRSASLLAPLMLLLMGNLAGLLEVVRALRVGWGTGAFWRWLDILELSDAPSGALTVDPLQFRFWWWWRASRVINDLDLGGRSIGLQPIDEFPAFSFVLGDLHPHVLALPFGLAVLGLALELMLAVREAHRAEARTAAARAMPWAWVVVAGVLIGGLAFLNTWDFPICVAICLGATWLGWRGTADRAALKALGIRWAALIGVSVAAYIPFYVGFASQAGGILPNLIFVTKAQQLLVMFAPVLIPLAGWLLVLLLGRALAPDWRRGAIAGVGAVLGLFMLSFFVGGLLLTDPGNQVFATEYIQPYSIREAIALVLRRRLLQPGTALLLGILIAMIVALLLRRSSPAEPKPGPDSTADDSRVPREFILLLGGAGAVLVLFPEFLYLRDQFGVRMNTIFKFYFQSWTFWSVRHHSTVA
jgi:YYY domain-containing protein